MHSQSRQTSVALQGPSSCEETAFRDRYEVLRTIGRGGCAEVHVARHLLTGAEVAVKVLPKVKRKLALSEPEVMRSLDHPNVIQLFQVIETCEHVYLVMEHATGGQALKHIPPRGMRQEEARRVFRQIAGAVGYCHSQGVVHLDLKLPNVVVDAAGTCKLIDFGLSLRVRPGQKLRRFWGTLAYLAPEILLRRRYEGPPADVWSLGVILFYLLTGRCPFRALLRSGMVRRIQEGRYHIPDRVPSQARRLIRSMLSMDPARRPTVEQVLQHPWLREGEEASPCQDGEPPPKRPDPAIMAALVDLGHDPYEAWVSLTRGKFDDAAAAYLILRHQLSQGAGCAFKGRPERPAHPSSGSVLPRRSTSELALRPCPSCRNHRLPEEAQHTGQKDLRRVSLTGTDLRWLLQRIPAPAPVPQKPSPSRKDTSTGQPKAWKRVARRLATCFRQLCCCEPCGSKEEDSPGTREQKRGRGRVRVAPM
ncbi:Sperm motility kinase 2B [Sciurus carolinensis]|uniref:non-specific serine/threonine protein kinase n=1 Tax=Sciurus carolinensis TaxID=30640 RepID=A0AA41N2T3_SCICA|nr:Sperm motility kinase 2B [Sciurus carolinensis]